MPSIPAAARKFYWPKENVAPVHFISELTFQRRPGAGLYDSRVGRRLVAPMPQHSALGCPMVPAAAAEPASPDPTAVGGTIPPRTP